MRMRDRKSTTAFYSTWVRKEKKSRSDTPTLTNTQIQALIVSYMYTMIWTILVEMMLFMCISNHRCEFRKFVMISILSNSCGIELWQTFEQWISYYYCTSYQTFWQFPMNAVVPYYVAEADGTFHWWKKGKRNIKFVGYKSNCEFRKRGIKRNREKELKWKIANLISNNTIPEYKLKFKK